MAAANSNPIWFIVRGMTDYVSRLYKSEIFDEPSDDISIEDRNLPTRLKIVLSDALDHFKNETYVRSHNHYTYWENREAHLMGSFRSGLLEIAKAQPHLVFLRECTLYIMSATEMEKQDFPEAINIVMNAIYHACMKSNQHKNFVQWVTEENYNENFEIENLSDDADQHNNEVPHNVDVQHDNEARHGADVQHINEARHGDDVQRNNEARHQDDVQRNNEARHGDDVQRNNKARHGDDVQHINESRHQDDVQRNNEARRGDDVQHKNDDQYDSEVEILLDYDSREIVDISD